MSSYLKDDITLYDHQKEAMAWMKKREENHGPDSVRGGLLCLSMGWGKSLTAAEHSLLSRTAQQKTPTLIVCPNAVIDEWKSNCFERFYTQELKVLYLHRCYLGKKLDELTVSELCKYDIVVTNYEMCIRACKHTNSFRHVCKYGEAGTMHQNKIMEITTRREPPFPNQGAGIGLLYSIPWARLILDESQRGCSYNNTTFRSLMALYATNRWCLTGTPVRNRDTDVWCQLRLCSYSPVTNPKDWRRSNREAVVQYMFERSESPSGAIRLPEKIETTHMVELDLQQMKVYQAVLYEVHDRFQEMLRNMFSFARMLALLTRLRQTCIAPNLLSKKSKNSGPTGPTGPTDQTEPGPELIWLNDVTGTAGIDSPKIKKIIDLIGQIPAGEKVLVFSMFRSCLELIGQAIETDYPDLKYEHVSGKVTGTKRSAALNAFRNDPEQRVLLINYKIGAEGLNLTEANHVIMVEPWWNSAIHHQAVARAWRNGQTKPVHVHWVITKNTIEQPILTMCDNKDRLSSFYLHGSDYNPEEVKLGKDELLKLLKNTNRMLVGLYHEAKPTTDTCGICLEDMLTGSIVACPTCVKSIHRECLKEWLKNSPSCVYCRSTN
jgi:SNF2 family DNA or RNA helicase